MGLLAPMYRQQPKAEVREVGEPPASPEKFLNWVQQASNTASGIAVTPDIAQRQAAVFSCCQRISKSVATLPLGVYRPLKDGGSELIRKHALYRILRFQANKMMTAYTFKQVMIYWAALRGNAYAYIESDDGGRITGLIPMRPDRMEVDLDDDNMPQYTYTFKSGKRQTYPWYKIFHYKGLTDDGLMGLSPITVCRETVALAIATEKHGAKTFANGARPGGVLTHPNNLSDDAIEKLRSTWLGGHGGVENAHKVAILEEGMEWKQVGMTSEDAQYLETRKFQRSEICGLYSVPPHMIGDLERATFSNIEHQKQEYVDDCLMSWLVSFEQECWKALLLEREKKEELFFKFTVQALLRGDFKSRYMGYAIGRQNGWLNADEIRELEDMNPMPDGLGKIYLGPSNMQELGQMDDPVQEPPADQPDPPKEDDPKKEKKAAAIDEWILNREAVKNSFRSLFARTIDRYVEKEQKAAYQAVRKIATSGSKEDLARWSDKFYPELREDLVATLVPQAVTFRGCIDKMGDEDTLVRRFVVDTIGQWQQSFLVRLAGSIDELTAPIERSKALPDDLMKLLSGD